MTKRFSAVALALGLCVAGGEARAQQPTPQAPQPGQRAPMGRAGGMQTGMMGCPRAGIPGLEVNVQDLPGGVAITYVSGPDYLETVRAQVHHIAAMQQAHAGQMGGMMGLQLPPSTAVVDDLGRGARLVLVARDRGQVNALRSAARQLASTAEQTGCPIGGMRGGMMGGQGAMGGQGTMGGGATPGQRSTNPDDDDGG